MVSTTLRDAKCCPFFLGHFLPYFERMVLIVRIKIITGSVHISF